jgi:hypothetical protein
MARGESGEVAAAAELALTLGLVAASSHEVEALAGSVSAMLTRQLAPRR